MDEKVLSSLLKKASDSARHAYAPYSGFHVGCAILLDNDQVVCGVNIENASYPVSICAERAAMAEIVSKGLLGKIKAVAVVTSASPPGSPCGMCRQVLSEFLSEEVPIAFGNHDGEVVVVTMGELLPLAFSKKALL